MSLKFELVLVSILKQAESWAVCEQLSSFAALATEQDNHIYTWKNKTNEQLDSLAVLAIGRITIYTWKNQASDKKGVILALPFYQPHSLFCF